MPKRKTQVREVLAIAKLCPVCKGTGKVHVKDKDGKTVKAVCPRCDGSGSIYV